MSPENRGPSVVVRGAGLILACAGTDLGSQYADGARTVSIVMASVEAALWGDYV